ncbi:histone deacetylase family protein [Pseudothermotoga lettingae]|uniref:Histone deacetylase superfamily n=1 Tax=Pseudothermotoga lettingae (strain ATCC BAA-301 / DSM 14385 / NBRC 107922 / TMO) TaxID=416591 RepID=A8F426_PSELT|nr:histone deacetylase family protein [Pseudothermotoga lettingae]ABV32910.1 histone deacetylase superfamily [Pseudothermotoga lettingae TMO]GLI48091.1 acetylpolyamine amidohydrolase [Pseudothermotoga lettingae TMO]
MKIVYDPSHIFHKPTKEIDNGRFIENPEKPERIDSIKDALILSGFDNLTPPNKFPMSYIYMVHDESYVEWLKNKSSSLSDQDEYLMEVFGFDRCFDTGTPVKKNTFEASKKAVDVVLTAASFVDSSTNTVYALTRPPGHHATMDLCGGYCYFNNAAIAAYYFLKRGADRIVILDLDFHHGNGTQQIFYDVDWVYYISIHGDPQVFYPWISGKASEIGNGPGEGFNLNLPLQAGSGWNEYSEALTYALREIKDYYPDLLIISLGFDTHKDDPVGRFSLCDEDYAKIARQIGALKLPVLVVQEGGYNPQANALAATRFFSALE